MAKTLHQKTNVVGFPKAGELIEITGAHELHAYDRTVMNLLYEHAHNSGQLGEIGVEWVMPMKALRSSQHDSNDHLRESLKRLMRVVVTVPCLEAENSDPRFIYTHLFDFFNVSAGNDAAHSTVRFGLPRQLQPVLSRSSRWGRIKAATVCAMTSKYAIALYELVQLRSGLDRCIETFPVGRFRELMGVPPGKLLRGPDFQRKVIDAAVVEVNGLSDYGVQIQLGRQGPRQPANEVTIAWWKKEGDGFRAAHDELQRPKAGRTARLRAAAPAKMPAKRRPRGVKKPAKQPQQLDLVDAIKRY